jgi:hypothetical protein
MHTLEIIVIAVIIVLVAAAVWLLMMRRRSAHLRSRFGPEYQRTVEVTGNVKTAERDLERREEHAQRLNIHPLAMAARERLAATWRVDQARFVDDPHGAVKEADRLVVEAMNLRGYPVNDFDERVDAISVEHPHLVQDYRAAHQIFLQYESGQGTTEDLRHALVAYRALFDELLENHAMK